MSAEQQASPSEPAEAQAPLAAFGGERPPAPEWYSSAVAQEPERSFTDSGGTRIETLAWGPRGAPGLLFLHGNGAHADWWSFIAPFFAEDRRVAAFSLAGMGRSDWRERYSLEQSVADALAVAGAAGLFEAEEKPVIVGHSLGAMVASVAASRHGDRFRAAVMVDQPFRSPERLRQWRDRRSAQPAARTFPKRVYPTLAEALGRFRFIPPQPSDHPYLVDHIARASLKQVEGGWTWRFDPQLWAKTEFIDILDDVLTPQCPIAIIIGEKSFVADEEDLRAMRDSAPPGTPVIVVPQAQHHLMVDQPLAFVTGLRALLAGWPPG